MIKVGFDEQALIHIENMIGDVKGAFETVVSRGINSTLLATRKEAVLRISDEVTLDKSRITQGIIFDKASVTKLSGKIICSKKPVGLIAYGAVKVPEGVSVSTFRKGSPKTIRHTFIGTTPKKVTADDGTTGIERINQVFSREKIYKKRFFPGRNYAAMQKQWRLPVNRKAGPSIYGIFIMSSVLDPVTIYGGHILTDRIGKAFDRFALKNPDVYFPDMEVEI